MTAPAPTADIPSVEEKKADETAPVVAPVVAPAEEKKVEEKPKPTKRGSIFSNFSQNLKSPTHEKKEADLFPAVPAKEAETSTDAPKLNEPATTEAAPVLPPVSPVEAAPLGGASEALKVEEPKEPKPAATTPHKEKQSFSFGKFLGGNKEKAKSPATEKALDLPKTEEAPKVEETPAVAAPVATEPVTEAPKEEVKDEPTTEAAAATTPTTKEKKRGSIFGALGRAVSKAGKPKKEKEPAATEAGEPKEEKTGVAPIAEETKEDTAAPAAPATEPAKIGDAVPEAVVAGQDSKSTPQVSATA